MGLQSKLNLIKRNTVVYITLSPHLIIALYISFDPLYIFPSDCLKSDGSLIPYPTAHLFPSQM